MALPGNKLPDNLFGARVYRPLETVAIADDVPDAGDDFLVQSGYQVKRGGLSKKTTPDELKALLVGEKVDALMMRTSLNATESVLADSRLQVVAGSCKRPKVDIAAARKLGIEVFGTHANTEQVVQLVMGALYSFSSGNVVGAVTTQNDIWAKAEIGKRTFTLRDKKLGIIGFGRIGRMLAERAKANGLQVLVFNDHSALTRHYEEYLDDYAQRIGVKQAESKEEVLDWADILTVHTGLEDHLGRSNAGLITPDDLRRLGKNGGLGMFINYDRHNIGPSHENIQGLLDEGALKYYATDVFPSEMEKQGAFLYPFNEGDQRVLTTPHIGGSNAEVLRRAAIEAVTRLDQWARHGDIRGDSLVYPRLDIRVDPYDGQVVFAIERSTRKRIFADTLKVFADSDLSVVDTRVTGDYMPGTKESRGVAHQVVLSDPDNGGPYEDAVLSVTERLASLNLASPGSVRSIRPIPTNPDQRDRLKGLFS